MHLILKLLIFSILTAFSTSQLITLPTVDNFVSKFSVKIHRQASFLCSGALITTRSVLSIASCVNAYSASELEMHFGTTRLTSNTGIFAESYRLHPHFRADNPLESNIAILRLSWSDANLLENEANLMPRQLGELLSDNFCSIPGFGELPSEVGHMVPAMMRNSSTCSRLFTGNFTCVFGVADEISTCGGFLGKNRLCSSL